MDTIAVTIHEIYKLCLVIYMLGLLTLLIPYGIVSLYHKLQEERIRREQFKIHRRTPFGI